ncbi:MULTISPECIES: winged helix-turn-helix domain-containing protein [Brenneria]|uniref:ArsR family transcriptional regulator n=1 Tax=Brenneria nigrifluens DSM 30175 = ATCC 13028 TaxID=1121120 RepID=A0A2U1UUA1_9GAMM|nr:MULTISPECIES: winged helix-turn-helix domain-containing protein [Brenneria]EHD21809.1 hypothetical protein BrE312_2429 [Brenneria sp. EniD312]PWC25161.1 ArsR family transcriptional regulator [Brenneria nigrifluens DSM 30175 = ATCC 13028]QCR04917.1 ArsR family transcriptional regulator [Brenneria nigrifluens DSM 30175 = ATCC 13028]
MVTKKLTTQQRVARYIRIKEGLTQGEIARGLNLTGKEVHHALGELRSKGVVEVSGTRNQYRYYPTGAPAVMFGVHPAQARLNKLLAEVRA